MVQSSLSQNRFLMAGGIYEIPLMKKRESGELCEQGAYVFQEFPKMLRIPLGVQSIEKSTETIKGTTLTWTETGETFADMVVDGAEAEAAVLLAAEQAPGLGIEIGTDWTAAMLLERVAIVQKPKKASKQVIVVAAAPVSAVVGDAPSQDDVIAALRAELAALKAAPPQVETGKSRRPHRRVRSADAAPEQAAAPPVDEAA